MGKKKVVDAESLTAWQILSGLRPTHLVAIASALAAMLSAAFGLGVWVQEARTLGSASSNPVTALAPTSPLQEELQGRPAIRSFEAFLQFTADGNWHAAWEYLGTEWRNKTKKAEGLGREYRMTKHHRVHHYTPVEITADRETYLIDFEYSDYQPDITVFKTIASKPLTSVLKPDQADEVIESLADSLLTHFRPPNETSREATRDLVRSVIERRANPDSAAHKGSITLRHLARYPNGIVDMVGNMLAWEPINAVEVHPKVDSLHTERLLRRVRMSRNADRWVLDSYGPP